MSPTISRQLANSITLQDRFLNLSKNRHKLTSANAVGTSMQILRSNTSVQGSSDTCASLIVKQMVNMKKIPTSSLRMRRLFLRWQRKFCWEMLCLCQWLRERSIRMGSCLFFFAIWFTMLKAFILSQGQAQMGDYIRQLVRKDSTKAGMAHRTISIALVSNCKRNQEVRLRNSGPTKTHASSRNVERLRDYYWLSSKRSVNWKMSEGQQWMQAITQPNILRGMVRVVENITTPNVYILHDILMAVFRPFTSATAPQISMPMMDAASGRIQCQFDGYLQDNSEPLHASPAEQSEMVGQGVFFDHMLSDTTGESATYFLRAMIIPLCAAMPEPLRNDRAVLRFLEQEELEGDEERGKDPVGSHQHEQFVLVQTIAIGQLQALSESNHMLSFTLFL